MSAIETTTDDVLALEAMTERPEDAKWLQSRNEAELAIEVGNTRVADMTPEVRKYVAMCAMRKLDMMLPILSGFARALVPGKNVMLKSTGGDSCTDGKTIWIRPPFDMGLPDDHPDSTDKEELFAILCHEVAHIQFDSAASVKNKLRRQLVEETAKKLEWDDAILILDKLEQDLGSSNYNEIGFLHIAGALHPSLPALVNALEDARVNSKMGEVRPGALRMFRWRLQRTAAEGLMAPDGQRYSWSHMPLDSQMILAVYAEAMGMREDFGNIISAEAIALAGDDGIKEAVARSNRLKTGREVFRQSVVVLKRLVDLGVMELADPIDLTSMAEHAAELWDEWYATCLSEDEQRAMDVTFHNAYGSGDAVPCHAKRTDRDLRSRIGFSGLLHLMRDFLEEAPHRQFVATQQTSCAAALNSTQFWIPSFAMKPDHKSLLFRYLDRTIEILEAMLNPEGESGGDGDEGTEEGDPSEGDPSEGQGGESPGDMGEESEQGGHASSSGDPKDDSGDDDQTAQGATGGDADDDGQDTPQGAGDDDGGDADDPMGDDGQRPGDTSADGDQTGTTTEGLEHAEQRQGGSTGEGGDVPFYSVASGEHTVEELHNMIAQATGHGDERLADDGTAFSQGSQTAANVGSTEFAALEFRKDFDATSRTNVAAHLPVDFPDDIRIGDMMWSPYTNEVAPMSPAVVVATANGLRRQMQANKTRRREGGLKRGPRLDRRRLAQQAPIGGDRVFAKHITPDEVSYHFEVFCDVSGSTAGTRMHRMRTLLTGLGDTLQRVDDVDFAITAHCMTNVNRGRVNGKVDWNAVNRANGGRNYSAQAIYTGTIKSASDRWAMVRPRIEHLTHCGGNFDGHAMQLARKGAERADAKHKVIVYVTDGQMPAANGDEELALLRRELRIIHKAEDLSVVGIGVDTDSPRQYGLDTLSVERDEDLTQLPAFLGQYIR